MSILSWIKLSQSDFFWTGKHFWLPGSIATNSSKSLRPLIIANGGQSNPIDRKCDVPFPGVEIFYLWSSAVQRSIALFGIRINNVIKRTKQILLTQKLWLASLFPFKLDRLHFQRQNYIGISCFNIILPVIFYLYRPSMHLDRTLGPHTTRICLLRNKSLFIQ